MKHNSIQKQLYFIKILFTISFPRFLRGLLHSSQSASGAVNTRTRRQHGLCRCFDGSTLAHNETNAALQQTLFPTRTPRYTILLQPTVHSHFSRQMPRHVCVTHAPAPNLQCPFASRHSTMRPRRTSLFELIKYFTLGPARWRESEPSKGTAFTTHVGA